MKLIIEISKNSEIIKEMEKSLYFVNLSGDFDLLSKEQKAAIVEKILEKWFAQIVKKQ